MDLTLHLLLPSRCAPESPPLRRSCSPQRQDWRREGERGYFLVFVQLFEKYGTLVERNAALIEKVSPCINKAHWFMDGWPGSEILPSLPAGSRTPAPGGSNTSERVCFRAQHLPGKELLVRCFGLQFGTTTTPPINSTPGVLLVPPF
eukprot:SAG31_NODE_2912_length_4920_cov_3.413192_1_plen_147_part_00